MTIDEILTQVDSMRGLAGALSGDARVFVLKACVELLGEATRLLRIEARGAKALVPADLASSPKSDTVPPTVATGRCDACGQVDAMIALKENYVNGNAIGWLHVDGGVCLYTSMGAESLRSK
jgi:hypothetical protein